MGETTRTMLVLAHTGRQNALDSARKVIDRLTAAGIAVRVTDAEAPALACSGADVVPGGPSAAEGAELAIVLGGDGSLLRAAELARPAGTPLIGVNLGHIGFLAEAEPDGLIETVDHLVEGEYRVEERMTLDVIARDNGTRIASTWALNDVTVEKGARDRMIDVIVEIDGRPLSRWPCDGVIAATPTGSTAYAFSAGGPVIWPEVEALLLVPIAAHALFARPLVVSPESVLAMGLVPPAGTPDSAAPEWPVIWCDGRRRVDLPPGGRVEVRRGALPVLLARIQGFTVDGAESGAQASASGGSAAVTRGEFTDRLVAKFGLPVAGWRGRAGHVG